MALDRIKNELWFREDLFPDVSQLIKVSKVLFKKITKDKTGKKLQELFILDTPRFGKMLTLDGAVQLTEADEKYYHEPLAHCAIFSHPNPKNILIIGGGDGGLLREVVKHPVRSITLVDIDKDVIELTKKYTPEFAAGSWSDKRLKVRIDDGAEFVKKTKYKYDVILLDTPDPVGPAKSLFQTKFYINCKKVLAPKGIVIRQTGSSVLQSEEMPSNFRQMEELFPEVKVFLTAVSTYIGGYFTFVAASPQKGVFKKALAGIEKRFNDIKLKTEWYTPAMHKASMILPRELESSLKKTEYGVELILDLYECDYSIITSKEKLYRFAKELCDFIKMKPYGEPLIPDFGFSLSKTAGFSLVQLIESSSITVHYSPHWGMVCLNIFTCKTFDEGKTLKFVKEFFRAKRVRAFLLKRGPRVFRQDLEIVSIRNPYEES